MKRANMIVILLLFSTVHSVEIGKIENNIMIGINNTNLLYNLTRDQCICQMVSLNGLISALNYFYTNQTCQLFTFNTSSILIQFNFNSSFIFMNQSAISITYFQSNITSNASLSSSLINAFWSFDGNMNERSLSYNSTSINSVSYFSPGITGYGSALCFNFSLSQYVIIHPIINFNLSYRSFTFELWAYPFSLLSTSNDRGMIGLCQSIDPNKCLHLTLRSNIVRMSFYSNPCNGTTPLTVNTWYHFAFVYNYSASIQMTYINGVSECNHTSSLPLQTTNSTYIPLTIGYTSPLSPYYFDGLIDQLSIVEWAKNSTEILDDATLVAYYSFDNNSPNDSGLNMINGITIGTIYDNNSLLFNQTKSYFQSSGFVLLGTNNRSYSFSLWIKPFQINNNTIIVHGYQNISSNNRWCLSFLSMNSQGKLQAQSRINGAFINVTGPSVLPYTWTHVVQTYSPTNGVGLYINGSLYNKSSSVNYFSSNTPISIRLGYTCVDTGNETCFNSSIQGVQYIGYMDEFRMYSRELTTSDVHTLSIK